VSRDIRVRSTDQTWNLSTHKIGSDVDFDRSYLLQDLLMSGLVERYGFVDGVRAAPVSVPRTDLTGDPYYTDGLRVVLFCQIKRAPWAKPRDFAGGCRRHQVKKHADCQVSYGGLGYLKNAANL